MFTAFSAMNPYFPTLHSAQLQLTASRVEQPCCRISSSLPYITGYRAAASEAGGHPPSSQPMVDGSPGNSRSSRVLGFRSSPSRQAVYKPNVNIQFKQQCDRIRQQLSHHNRYVIHPRKSRWVPHWDSILVLAMIYTCILTPVEICLFKDVRLGEATDRIYVTMFVLNQCCNAVFATDLVLNFFLAYEHEGRWVTKLKQIRWHCVCRSRGPSQCLCTLPANLLRRFPHLALMRSLRGRPRRSAHLVRD